MVSITTKEIKKILLIEDPEKDEYIETVLPYIIDMVEDYCNDTFTLRDEHGRIVKVNDEYLLSEGGIVVPIAKIIEFYMHTSGISQESISRVMYSYTNSLPVSITAPLNAYRKVKFV